MKVLIVDDSPEARFCLREQLSVLGHSVVGEAEDLKGAIALYRQVKPELVMLDLTLEREDGLTVLRSLRGADPSARVAILSANQMESIKQEALEAGACAYLLKPVDEAQLTTLLSES